MKILLYAAILGFALWTISEIMELASGYEETGYYLTAVFHGLAGFGIWGLHLLQAKEKNALSLVGTAMISIAYFSIVYFPIQVMDSGLAVSQYIDQHRIYVLPLTVFVIGHIIFGIAVIRTDYFPDWTGVVFIASVVILTGIYSYEILSSSVPTALQDILNVTDIVLALTVIYMCVSGLRKLASR